MDIVTSLWQFYINKVLFHYFNDPKVLSMTQSLTINLELE